MRVAAVDVGDWDMHVDLGRPDSGWMFTKLTELGQALAAFATDLGAGLDNVTLVTLSEFGRRVAENGSGGLDHGHGNVSLLLGGGVAGGKVHGTWPGLSAPALVNGDLAGDHRLPHDPGRDPREAVPHAGLHRVPRSALDPAGSGQAEGLTRLRDGTPARGAASRLEPASRCRRPAWWRRLHRHPARGRAR